jgi:hypothetical protein
MTSAHELAELLRNDCEGLFRTLISDAYIDGGELCGHMSDGSKVKMALRPGKRGQWLNCHRAGEMGDPLDLITYCNFHGDRRAAYAWGCRYLRIHDHDCRSSQSRLIQPPKRPPQDYTDAPLRSSPVGFYLRGVADSEEVASYQQHRLRVRFDRLPRARCLRFLARCLHKETNTWLAAMLAPVIHLATRQHIATHRTYLSPVLGVWGKAPVKPAKKLLGGASGGVIPLLRGASGKPLREAGHGETVMIAEGIENALAAAYLLRGEGARVWAAWSRVNFIPIAEVMPPQFTRVVIVKDNDSVNDSADKALRMAVDMLINQGREVTLLSAPSCYKDMAAFLSQEGPVFREDAL